MSPIPIPENSIGRVGMVAVLKRVGESDIGKLVVLREPAGFVTSLVGSDKPVFAWLALSLGEPIICNGKQSRSNYVADRCLIPISDMTEAEIEIISRSQAKVDFDSALADMKSIIDGHNMTPEELDSFVDKAAAHFSISRALEEVAVPVALREIGFYPSPESDDSLVWTGIHDGMELHFLAGEKWIANWVIVGTGNSKRQAVWDERTLSSQAPRGKIFSTVLDIWRTAFGKSVVPDCLELGAVYERHQAEMKNLNLGLPNLWLDPNVFRTVLKWLRTRHTQESNELLTLSFSDRLLRLDVEGVAYGCSGGGNWIDDCKVNLSDFVNLSPIVCRSRSIRLVRDADHILVNSYPIEIQAA